MPKLPEPDFFTPLEELDDAALRQAGVRVLMKRDDLYPSVLSGNKQRKLKYNLQAALTQGYAKLATFGGAYSNHIHAVAAAGKLHGFATYGFIRGEEHLPLNPVLDFAVTNGMTLLYVDRESYRLKGSPEMRAMVAACCGECYLLPEGGTNELAVQGCAEIVPEITVPFDVMCCAVGTGGTLAGIVRSLSAGQRAIGFATLMNDGFLKLDVARWLGSESSTAWSICNDYACGGYAKTTPALLEFIAGFTARTGIPLDRVYTSKMMFGLYAMIARGAFTPGTTIVALHSGGYVSGVA